MDLKGGCKDNRSRLFPLMCTKMQWTQTETQEVSPEQKEIFFPCGHEGAWKQVAQEGWDIFIFEKTQNLFKQTVSEDSEMNLC